MRFIRKSEKGIISVLLILALLISVVACTLVVSAKETDRLTPQGADTYYLWGLNTNDPDFGAMSSPTGTFTYDSSKGYYYYDLKGVGGDYCFVVSKVNNSGTNAVKSPAVGGAAEAGKYYLSQGNYRGYACMHLWNPAAEDVRIYFVSENGGLYAIKATDSPATPTTAPVTPTTAPVTPTTPSGSTQYVYCKNDAGWDNVYIYMWNGNGGSGNENSSWPGVKATKVDGNVWGITTSTAYANVIFTNNSGTQTADLSFPGSGYMYNNSTGAWSVYGGGSEPTTAPVTPTTAPVNPTTAPVTPTTPPSSGARYVYCENEAGWSIVSVYMWNGKGETNNGSWPGKSATNIGGDIWRYEVPAIYANIIFSESGNNQSADLSYPGDGYIYNNSTRQWDIYDTSPLQVQTFTTDLAAPQFAGVGIVMSAKAEGEGTVRYRFTATDSSNNTVVVSDYSVKSSALWTPKTAGTYTLTFEFKDTAGNTNKRTLSYAVKDGNAAVEPYIKQVTPVSGEQIKKSSACNISVSAAGGLTGTNLLFYKYTVKDSSGNIINTPYYTLRSNYSFTPTGLGEYTVTVSVQSSDNTTVERSYVYSSVDNIVTPTEPADQPTEPGGSSGSTLKGDADGDGKVTIIDATRIQRWLAALATDSEINTDNADVDGNGKVTITDATTIQRYLAGIIKTL